jgi:hypothetical protein
MTVEPNKPATRDFPRIIGVNPAAKQQNDDLNEPGDPDPGTCASLPSCDVVPLTVVQPRGLSVFDSFSLQIELRWRGSGAVTSDLDLYLWYDPQGTVVAKKSVSTNNPERITFSQPTSVNYQVVVNNASGANDGYTLAVTSRYVRGDRPSDLDLGAGTSVPSLDVGGTVSMFPTPSTAPSGSSAGPALTPSSLVASDVDPDLGGLSASGTAPKIFREAGTSSAKPKPVSGGVVLLWAVIVPLLAVAAAVTLLYRRRPRALQASPRH